MPDWLHAPIRLPLLGDFPWARVKITVPMNLNTVQQIERAIRALTPHEIEELYAWLEQHCPRPTDPRIQSDLTAGRLDTAIQRALDDEKNGHTQPLIS
jgi:hypothetical protein